MTNQLFSSGVSVRQSLTRIEKQIERQKTFITALPQSSRYPYGAQEVRRFGLKSVIPNYGSNTQLERLGSFGN